MRIAAILLGIVLVLILAGLAVAPQLFDVDRFKTPIAAQLSQRTGEPVEIAGPIALSLLPAPALTARDVRIANPPGAAAASMLRLRALEVKLAVLPLLAGRIEPRSATFIEPEVDLERLPDGTPNWRQAPAAAAPAGAPGAPAAPEAPDAGMAALAHLTVQNGAVTWRAGGGVERFEHINADLAFDPASRQVAATGELVARGAAVTFDLRSGAPGAAEVPLQLTVTTRPAARLQIDALLTGPAAGRRLSGKVKLTSGDARGFLGTLARLPLPGVLAQPLAVTAELSGSESALALDHLAIDWGPVHGEGSFHAQAGPTPLLALALSVGQVDIDRWPAAQQAALQPAAPGLALAAVPGAALVAVQRGLGGTVLPRGVRAQLDLGVDVMLWHGGIVRDARLKVGLADGRLTLTRLAALLPGGSDLSLSGSATTPPEGARANGVLELNADDLRSLCGWFGLTMDRIPADRLRRASLSSRLALAGDRLDVDALDVTLDATRLSGAATVLLRSRLGIGLRLAADRFNLDAYLPQQPAPPPPTAAASTAAAPSPPAAGLLTGLDANLDLKVQALTWHGQPLTDVHAAGTLENGEATIRELGIGDIGGASANLSGVIDGLDDITTGQLAFDMHGPELERVLRILAPKLARGRRYGAFSLGGGLQYDRQTATVDTDLQIVDGHVHVVGDITRANGALDLGFDLDHPSFARLVRVFSPLYQPAQDPGAVKLSGRLSGEAQRFTLERVALAIGQGTLKGTIGVDRSGPRTHLDADLTAGDWAIDRLLSARQSAALEQHFAQALPRRPAVLLAAARPPAAVPLWSEDPIDFAVLRRADLELKLAAHSLAYGDWRLDGPTLAASVKDGVLSLTQLNASLLGGSLEASGEASGIAVPGLKGHLALRGVDLKEALARAGAGAFLDGRCDIDAELGASGGSAAEMVARLAGEATLRSGGGSLAGVDLKAMNEHAATRASDLASLLRSGSGGRTPFTSLAGSFKIADGIAHSDDLRLSAEGGDGRAAANFNLPQWTMASRVEFRLSSLPDAPPLVMRLDGSIDAPRTVFEINALEQYLARHAPAHP